MVPDVRKRLEVPQMQFCVVGDVLVTMQLLCGVYGDRAVMGFRRIFTAFFGLLFGVEALPIHDCGDVDIHTHS